MIRSIVLTNYLTRRDDQFGFCLVVREFVPYIMVFDNRSEVRIPLSSGCVVRKIKIRERRKSLNGSQFITIIPRNQI